MKIAIVGATMFSSYIADTFNIEPKKAKNVLTIEKSSHGWYIHNDDNDYLHLDGVIRSTMFNANTSQYNYLADEQSAIDLCKKYNYDYVIA